MNINIGNCSNDGVPKLFKITFSLRCFTFMDVKYFHIPVLRVFMVSLAFSRLLAPCFLCVFTDSVIN